MLGIGEYFDHIKSYFDCVNAATNLYSIDRSLEIIIFYSSRFKKEGFFSFLYISELMRVIYDWFFDE